MRSVKHYESNTKRNCIFCVPKKIWILIASYLAVGLDAVEENSGALPCLGSKVVSCTLGEGLIVLPPRRGYVWEHCLATLLGVSQVG